MTAWTRFVMLAEVIRHPRRAPYASEQMQASKPVENPRRELEGGGDSNLRRKGQLEPHGVSRAQFFCGRDFEA